MTKKSPSYRYHKARRCAVVTIDGRDHYLGTYDSPESWEKYHRLVAEFLAAKQHPLPTIPTDTPLTVTELIASYWKYAKVHYVKEGKPTSEISIIRVALRFLKRLYGRSSAADLTPKKLKAVREDMIRHEIARDIKAINPTTGAEQKVRKVYHRGLSRRSVNKLISRIKRMYAWAVEEELVNVQVHAALLRVRGLQKGKSQAREKPRVRPVTPEDIERTLDHVPPMVRTMIQVQRLCGGRPQEIVQMRGADIDRTGPIWEYRPPRYKTEHHQDDAVPDQERVLFIGPKCQELLRTFLEATPTDYLFSPRRSEQERNKVRRAHRASPVTPSQAARRPKKGRQRPPQLYYSVSSYRRAIRRACEKIGLPIWCPNQLRHTRLTEIRKMYGLEASRVCGGHREVGVTQIYAEQDHDLARKVMAEVG